MKMDQLENFETSLVPQTVYELHELRGAEPELRLFTAALRPPTGAFRMQLDAHARSWSDAKLVGHLKQHVDFAQLLEHDVHLVAQLLTHEGEAHELLVLVSVAHDEMIRVLGESEHGLKLGFAAALETHAGSFSELDDLFHHVSLLIHLDRVNRGVSAGVLVLPNGTIESFGQGFDARAEDVGESEQQRQADALRLEVVREIEKVELTRRVVRIGPDHDVALFIDVEVTDAPPLDVVEGAGGVDRPFFLTARVRHRRSAGHRHAESLGHADWIRYRQG